MIFFFRRILGFNIRNNDNCAIIGAQKTSAFRKYQNQYLREVRKLPASSILNVGSVMDESDKEGSLYADYFKGKEYYTLDKNRPCSNEHHFCSDLHDLTSMEKRFDLVLCMSVLEHVENPFSVAGQLISLLSPNGWLYLSVPFFYPYHPDEQHRYGDFWRFSESAIPLLFPKLDPIWIRTMPSVLLAVRDRPSYYDDPTRTAVGFGILLQNKI